MQRFAINTCWHTIRRMRIATESIGAFKCVWCPLPIRLPCTRRGESDTMRRLRPIKLAGTEAFRCALATAALFTFSCELALAETITAPPTVAAWLGLSTDEHHRRGRCASIPQGAPVLRR